MSVPLHLWQKTLLHSDSCLREAISCLNESSLQIVLVTDNANKLLGTVTDGDIRRALLAGLNMDSPLLLVMRSKAIVVPPEMPREVAVNLMRVNKLRQLPIVDSEYCLVGLHLWDEGISELARDNIMIIMAGGLGRRMRPHTENCPKPMLQVSGKPILQHIIERASQDGFHHFVVAVNYLGHVIENFFGDGSRFGVRIDYLREKLPLGTAGALGLLELRPANPFVVINGDVISDIRYGEMLDFHLRYNAMATMAVRLYEWQHPFGVVQTDGVNIVGFEEKPVNRSQINAGIYVLSPDALSFIVPNERLDMPSLFELINEAGDRAIAYPMHEPWIDVGRPNDLVKANVPQ